MSLHVESPHPHRKPSGIASKVFGDAANDDFLASRVIPITLHLFHSEQSPPCLNFQYGFLDSKVTQKRSLEDEEEEIAMSRRGSGAEKLDLSLNLSPPPPPRGDDQSPPSRSASVSPPSSCLSSEEEGGGGTSGTSMVLVGCPRCLMYVMLPQHDPKCPKCKSDVLLDFLRNNNNDNNNNNHRSGSSKKTRKQ